ncbi:glycosyltransferase family 39 protein [Tautonia sociabilis]|nr:glycosyltransferase family 39 protein [Tautonia sociabilis]
MGPPLLIAAVMAVGAAGNTGFDEPPRFDGAGYAMLARSLLDGRGYRSIDQPDAPPHVHFPPGYPAVLAAAWAVVGRSAAAAHALSIACTTGAAVAAWRWFRGLFPARVATLLGLALAMNWTWHRVGGEIQSEPLYMLCQQLALLAALAASGKGGASRGARLGAWLGAMMLTRLIGAAVAVAVGLELMIRRRWGALAASVAVASVVFSPWAWRLATGQGRTHLSYFPEGSLPSVIAGNAWFYVLRVPDALTGPFVEVGTVFSPRAYPVAAIVAVAASLIVARGLFLSLRAPRRRAAGLVVVCNLALLLSWPYTEAGRFLVPLVPALLVVAAEGGADLARLLGRRRPLSWVSALLLAAAMPYSVYAVVTDRAGAERRLQQPVDAALDWIARSGDLPGPIMTAYPAEAFWFTDRPGVVPPAGGPDAIAREIDRLGVAYLVLAEGRFARAESDPLSRFVAERPDRVRLAWQSVSGSVAVFEVVDHPTR